MNKDQLKKLEADLWRAADSLLAKMDLTVNGLRGTVIQANTSLRKFAAAVAVIGAAREQVGLMTARGPCGVVMLPTPCKHGSHKPWQKPWR